jgi:hypothetical protein
MAGVIDNYYNIELRAVVRLSQAEGLSQRKIHPRLVTVYAQSVSGKRKYLCGGTNLKMAEWH